LEYLTNPPADADASIDRERIGRARAATRRRPRRALTSSAPLPPARAPLPPGPRRVAARVARTRAPNASASASSSSSVAAPSERLALAAASVGRVFRAAQTQTQTTTTTPPAPAVAPPPSLFARAREFASEQSAKGRAMAKDLGVQDATLLFVTAAAMRRVPFLITLVPVRPRSRCELHS
jgi:hypothetical protein